MRPFALPIVVALLLCPSAVAAQTTPWGDPDLQGVWTNQTPVPLERPPVFANKPYFTEAEAEQFRRTALGRLLRLFEGKDGTSGELSEIWLETQDGKISRSLRTSLITDPPDGKIPYSAEGLARWKATPTNEGELEGRLQGTDRPTDRSLVERCITTDGVLVPNPFYNNYHRIVQAPGVIVIVSEMMHEARVIPLDGRPSLGEGIRQWLGESRGRWEEGTLVVETANFNDKRRFRGATSGLRLIERFTRLDGDAIRYQLTVSDPATFTRPWSLENTLWRTDEQMYEVDCHEGNYGLANILAGARAQERR